MLRMIVPIDVTDSVLTSSNILENDYPVWSAATSYSLGDRVIVLSTHSVYESLQAGNLNRNPVTDSALETPLWWVRVGATNKWKAFDDVIQDQASRSGGITYELDVVSRCDGIALFNLDAESVTVRVVDPIAPRRNLLVSTGDFNHASWTKSGLTYLGYVSDPEGGATAQSFSTSGGSLTQSSLVEGNTTRSIWIRSNSTSTVLFGAGLISVGTEWTRINSLSDANFVAFPLAGTYDIWHPQVEYGNEVTEYQSVDAAGVWDNEVYNSTRELQDFSSIDDYWSYFFDPIEKVTSIIFEDVPAFAGTTVTVYVNSSGVARVGEVVLGQNYRLGKVHAGAGVGFQDFSRIERDVFGNLIIIQRPTADTLNLNFEFDASKIASIKRTLSNRRAKPSVFHAGAEFEKYGLLAYGLVKTNDFPIVTQNLCIAQIEIEGLT